MAGQLLGSLGGVDENATQAPGFVVDQIGLKYRVARCVTVDGVGRVTPIDDVEFDNERDCRRAVRARTAKES